MRIHGIYNASFGFSVVNTFPMGESYPALLQEYLYIGLMTTAALLLCVTLCYLFFRRYLMKITLLLSGLSAAGKDLNHRIPVEGESDEIDSICIQTNAMLDTIQENIDKNYAQELEKQRALLQKRKAELYALQTQIDPHFVYNTLEMIRMQLVVKGDFTSADSIKLLGGILRQLSLIHIFSAPFAAISHQRRRRRLQFIVQRLDHLPDAVRLPRPVLLRPLSQFVHHLDRLHGIDVYKRQPLRRRSDP